jgi:predicted membrane GTPase involved in stress response
VVNKVDKPGANPDKVVNAAFDLFDKLGATDEQLDFPVVYASGINGWSSLTEGAPGEQWGPDMSALFDTILAHVPAARRATRKRRCSCRFPRSTSPASSAASAWAASTRARCAR